MKDSNKVFAAIGIVAVALLIFVISVFLIQWLFTLIPFLPEITLLEALWLKLLFGFLAWGGGSSIRSRK